MALMDAPSAEPEPALESDLRPEPQQNQNQSLLARVMGRFTPAAKQQIIHHVELQVEPADRAADNSIVSMGDESTMNLDKSTASPAGTKILVERKIEVTSRKAPPAHIAEAGM